MVLADQRRDALQAMPIQSTEDGDQMTDSEFAKQCGIVLDTKPGDPAERPSESGDDRRRVNDLLMSIEMYEEESASYRAAYLTVHRQRNRLIAELRRRRTWRDALGWRLRKSRRLQANTLFAASLLLMVASAILIGGR